MRIGLQGRPPYLSQELEESGVSGGITAKGQ
jgi:hypothetical protein